MVDMRNACNILVEKPEGKRALGKSRRKWVDIKSDRKDFGYESVDWIRLAQDMNRLRSRVDTEINFRVL
jgi:hypothetical protein